MNGESRTFPASPPPASRLQWEVALSKPPRFTQLLEISFKGSALAAEQSGAERGAGGPASARERAASSGPSPVSSTVGVNAAPWCPGALITAGWSSGAVAGLHGRSQSKH